MHKQDPRGGAYLENKRKKKKKIACACGGSRSPKNRRPKRDRPLTRAKIEVYLYLAKIFLNDGAP